MSNTEKSSEPVPSETLSKVEWILCRAALPAYGKRVMFAIEKDAKVRVTIGHRSSTDRLGEHWCSDHADLYMTDGKVFAWANMPEAPNER